MAQVVVRGLDDHVREKLRIRAAEHGRSMEAEIREILTAAVGEDEPLIMQLRRAAQALGGIDLDDYLPGRAELPRNPFASGE